MTIRPATADDVPTLLAWGRAFFQESVYSQFSSWSDTAVEVQIRTMLEDTDSVIFVIDGVGMIGGSLSQPYYSETDLVAQEMWWYVLPEARRSKAGQDLMVAFCAWAKESGATQVSFSTNKRTHPGVHGFLIAASFLDAETSYIGVF